MAYFFSINYSAEAMNYAHESLEGRDPPRACSDDLYHTMVTVGT